MYDHLSSHRLSLCIPIGVVRFFFQAEDGIRDLVRSRGLGDVYKRQGRTPSGLPPGRAGRHGENPRLQPASPRGEGVPRPLSLIHI